MDQQVFETAKAAYNSGDWAACVRALEPEVLIGHASGEACHLFGNAQMSLGRFREAAEAYAEALKDEDYGHVGALCCNRGRALIRDRRFSEAIEALTKASCDAEYPTPYKAFLFLGDAYKAKGDIREAGIAYRDAAIDDKNPNPSEALLRLGACFMELGRPSDAVEAYRTALDFTVTPAAQNPIYARLGCAYAAGNKMSEALDAFTRATTSGEYQLTTEESASYNLARAALSRAQRGPSETDQFLARAGYGSYDPLDPMGKSGEMIPSPEDTGFFTISEQDLLQQEQDERKMRRKHRGLGLKIFLFILFLLVLAAGVLVFAYTRGYGWPTQQAVIERVFEARAQDAEAKDVLMPSGQTSWQVISQIVPRGAKAEITALDMGMTESKAQVVATLPQGGKQNYVVELAREGLGWKIARFEASYDSQNGSSPNLAGAASTTGSINNSANGSTNSQSNTNQDSSNSANTSNQSGQSSGSDQQASSNTGSNSTSGSNSNSGSSNQSSGSSN